MTLTCDICSLIPWLWLLWDWCANPLIAGSFLSQAGGEERNGNSLWEPPPLPLSLQSQWAKIMWMDEVNYFTILWEEKGFSLSLVSQCKCRLPFTQSQCNGKLWSHGCSLLPTIIMHPAASVKTTIETLIGIQECLSSAVPFQEWAGQDISRYTLRSGGLSWSPTHLPAHTGPCQWDCPLPWHAAHQRSSRMLTTEETQLYPFINELWHWVSSRNPAPLTDDNIF